MSKSEDGHGQHSSDRPASYVMGPENDPAAVPCSTCERGSPSVTQSFAYAADELFVPFLREGAAASRWLVALERVSLVD